MKYFIAICFSLAIGSNLCAQVDLEKNLVAKYPMNGNILDVSPNSSASKLYGVTLANDAKGTPEKAYQFDGIDDYIELDKFQMQQSFSFGFWLNSTDTIRNQSWVASNTSNHNNIDQGDNPLIMGQYSKTVMLRLKFSKITIDTLYKGWAHYAITCNKLTASSSEITFYKNGKLKLIDTIPSVFDISGTFAWCLGQEWDNSYGTMVKSDYFEGSMDDFWVFNRVLTKDEINNLITPVPKLAENTFGACSGVDAFLSLEDPTVQWYSADKSTKLAKGQYNAGKLSVGSYTYLASKTVNGIESIPSIQKLEVKQAEKIGSIVGDTQISSVDVETDYTIIEIPHSGNYIWAIEPATAGTIEPNNNNAIVTWSRSVPESAKLSVVADVTCAVNGISANSISDTATSSITFLATALILNESNKLYATPNPSTGSLTYISQDVTSLIEINLYNLAGTFVLKQTAMPNISFDILLPSGDYIAIASYKIGANTYTQTEKITIK